MKNITIFTLISNSTIPINLIAGLQNRCWIPWIIHLKFAFAKENPQTRPPKSAFTLWFNKLRDSQWESHKLWITVKGPLPCSVLAAVRKKVLQCIKLIKAFSSWMALKCWRRIWICQTELNSANLKINGHKSAANQFEATLCKRPFRRLNEPLESKFD